MDIKEVLEDFKRILTRMGEESQENAENLDLTELWDITEAALDELKEKDVVKVSPEKERNFKKVGTLQSTKVDEVLAKIPQSVKDEVTRQMEKREGEDQEEPAEGTWNKGDYSDYNPQWDFRTSAGSGDTIITLTNDNNLTFVATLPSKNFHSNDMIEIIRKLNA